MPASRLALILAACLVAGPACAQQAPGRVEREASNPMRLIIEAAKIKPKARPAEAAASVPARTRPGAAAASAAGAAIEVLPAPPSSSVATVELETESSTLRPVERVEPVIPRELQALVQGEVQILVAFVVLPDGRVAEASVRRSSHPELNATVLDAVRQWRYQPIGAATPHEVDLVLRPDS